jgi:hypothetical protein
MTAPGYNVELREHPEGWRANFNWVGIAHSVVLGPGWEPTPWGAVQEAAWQTLTNPKST